MGARQPHRVPDATEPFDGAEPFGCATRELLVIAPGVFRPGPASLPPCRPHDDARERPVAVPCNPRRIPDLLGAVDRGRPDRLDPVVPGTRKPVGRDLLAPVDDADLRQSVLRRPPTHGI